MFALVINAVWINASEIFRYFVFVMPMMRAEFPGIVDIAPMNVAVFLAWGIWDIILLFFATSVSALWLTLRGHSVKEAILAGASIWAGVFGIFWLAMLNMNLATLKIVAVALPLALLEMIVAALITRWALMRK